ncbi:MAG TPA: hypothetical protein DCM87_15190 [Planctomycetes bacterium]|nr:hypothetical protein [Planctomycetota bacterium]
MEQLELLRKIIETLEDVHVPYALVGSMASGAYGEPRMTRDIDIVADLRAEHVSRLCAAFPAAEYYVSKDAAFEAVLHRGQFNIIHAASANKIDIMLPRRGPWEEQQLSRARRMRIFSDLDCSVAAPEDVIIAKLRYYREGGSEKHVRDIAGILKVSCSLVDREYVARWAEALGLGGTWHGVLGKIAGG